MKVKLGQSNVKLLMINVLVPIHEDYLDARNTKLSLWLSSFKKVLFASDENLPNKLHQ